MTQTLATRFSTLKKRQIILDIICYVFILLFLYTAMSKWFDFPLYVEDLGRSPLTKPVAPFLAIVLPAVEIAISIALFVPRWLYFGLLGALALMVLFTLYVFVAIFIMKDTPCSCGGLIRDLTWRQHLIFNLSFTSLAVYGLWLYRKIHRSSDN